MFLVLTFNLLFYFIFVFLCMTFTPALHFNLGWVSLASFVDGTRCRVAGLCRVGHTDHFFRRRVRLFLRRILDQGAETVVVPPASFSLFLGVHLSFEAIFSFDHCPDVRWVPYKGGTNRVLQWRRSRVDGEKRHRRETSSGFHYW